MKTAPVISIVTPAFNAGRFLAATLDSMRAQTFTDWECVIVDDGSTDDTAEVAERYARDDARIRLVRQANRGPSAARNAGFAHCNPAAEYVAFMDGDDLWTPDALKTLHDVAERHPEAVGAHALGDFIDDSGAPMKPGAFADFGRRRIGYDGRRIVEWDLSRPTAFETLCWTGPLYPPGLMLARRSAYECVGLYDERMPLCEDWDMAIRLTRLGDIQFIDKVILGYRRHGTNVSLDFRGNQKGVRQIYWKTFFSPENNARQRQIVRRGWRAWQLFKMREKLRFARARLAQANVARAISHCAEVGAHMLRWLRGQPTSGGI